MSDVRKPADYSPERDGTRFFYFMDDPCFPCHPTGSYWNGFANVRVSPEVRALIAAHWESTNTHPDEAEQIAELLAIEPDSDGLIDLSNCYATDLDEEENQA